MFDSGWYALAGTIVLAIGGYIGMVKRHDKLIEDAKSQRESDEKALQAWRDEQRDRLERLSHELTAVGTMMPAVNERVAAVEREQAFQRGRLHELANLVARGQEQAVANKDEIVRLRTKVYGQ